MIDTIADALARYPGLVSTLALLLIPMIGAALSYADAWAAKRWPLTVAFLRALLPDVKRAAAVLAVRTLEERKLPVPPEVRELASERIEKAIERATGGAP